MSRQGQVWEGPIDRSDAQAHLVLWRSPYDEGIEKHDTLNLTTGRRAHLLMKGIENDSNWRRLA